jgi:hypothetical protein
MKAALIFIVVLSAVVLLAFAVHDAISFGMGISSSPSHAPKQFRGAVWDAVAWGIEYKELTTAACIVCLAVLYLGRNPAIKNR